MELTSKKLVDFADRNDYEITEEDVDRIIELIKNDNSYGNKISKEDILNEVSNYIDENYFILESYE